MTALAADLEVTERDGVVQSAPMVATDTIYRGAIVMHNAAGFLAPAATGAGSFFAGIAEEQVTNTGSAGDKNCKYKRTGVYLLTSSGLAQADIGTKVYASDDQTLTTTSTNNVLVGQIVEFVSATSVWVSLEHNSVISA